MKPESKIKRPSRYLAHLVRHLRMLVNYAKTAHALEAAWYAMKKHAPAECSREIATSKDVLIRIWSLPNTQLLDPQDSV